VETHLDVGSVMDQLRPSQKMKRKRLTGNRE